LFARGAAAPTDRPGAARHRVDRSEEEDQTGSSQRWFVCDRCGLRYPAPPKRTA